MKSIDRILYFTAARSAEKVQRSAEAVRREGRDRTVLGGSCRPAVQSEVRTAEVSTHQTYMS